MHVRPHDTVSVADGNKHEAATSSSPVQSSANQSQFTPRRLSAFSMAKAERLIRDRLPCLGCHQLDGEGGRIAPNLSDVGARLYSSAVYEMIVDPQQARPGSMMPKTPMSGATVDLITNYLVQRSTQTAQATRDIVSIAIDTAQPEDAAALYRKFCSACHGVRGDGDGFNAAFLPVNPTAHSDSAYMSTRPDDVLFDGIYAGGYILGRSHRMPGFGQTLNHAQIRGLVRYLRELCSCEGPDWSRDNS